MPEGGPWGDEMEGGLAECVGALGKLPPPPTVDVAYAAQAASRYAQSNSRIVQGPQRRHVVFGFWGHIAEGRKFKDSKKMLPLDH